MHERELRLKLEQIGETLRQARIALDGTVTEAGIDRAIRNVEALLKPDAIRVVRDAKSMTRLKIAWKTQYCNCPACGERVRSGSPFWSHYESRHALRPRWLNPGDYEKVFGEPYVPPPEER